jgi:hypothetical protein
MKYPKYCTVLVFFITLNLLPHPNALAFDRHKLSFSFRGDWTNYNIKGIKNTKYQFPNMIEPQGLISYGSSRISGGWGLNASIKYRASRSFLIGPSLLYIGDSKTEYFGPTFFDDYVNRNPIAFSDLKVGLLAPGISMSYQLLVDKILLRFNSDFSWMFGSAKYTSPLIELPPSITKAQYNFSGQGLGIVLSLTPSIPLGKGFSIEPVMGYRFLKSGELKDYDGKHWYNMNLNFSGPFIGMGFGLKSR